MYIAIRTKQYRKSYKRISKQAGFDKHTVDTIIETLARGERLDAKYCDHKLSGELAEYRECHIRNDLLLVYQKKDDIFILLLINIGSHDDIFG